MALDDKRWTKYTVPYAFTDQITAYYQEEIYRGMHSYERFTCMRFVEWTDEGGVTTNDRLGLGYEGHLKFLINSGCNAPLGNKKRVSDISCCTGKECVHELGHALGMTHEAPSPDRDGWMRANYQNMQNKYPYEQWLDGEVLDFGYDYSSVMHYASWMMSSGGPTFNFLFPELHTKTNYYYVSREISLAHKCEASPACAASARTCDNDGYFTLLDGRCGCRCIQGLDPETGCTSTMNKDPAWLDFPGGEYAFPMPATGCPDGFTTGTREHFGKGGNTESHPDLLEGEVSEDKAKHHFCSRSNSDSSVPWPAGNYCIYKKGGTCPNGFREGSVRYDDVGSPEKPNSIDGSLPDGQYTSTSTQFSFCCRTDGFEEDEIFFPSRQAFTLFKYPKWDCQPVRGMHSTAITSTIYSVPRVSDVAVTGRTPVSSQDVDEDKIVLDICYYTPADLDCGGIYEVDSSNPTVTVTSKSGANQECVYLFKAPEGQTMILNTPSINIHCDDTFEIRHARPQQPAEERFCGSSRDMSTRSILNNFMVRFRTFTRAESHFTMTVSLVEQEDHCYDFADRGTSYAGTVDVSRNFEPCLRWDEVTHCPHHAFSMEGPKVELSENYCRNPNYVDGFRPWCYTETLNCVRNYCDVCQLENRYDNSATCKEVDQQELCDDKHRGMKFCAKTCENSLPWGTTPPKVSTITCAAPGSVKDADIVDTPLKASYSVGSEVTYRCPDTGHTVKRTCLTTGRWSTLNTVCRDCTQGWTKYNGVCYKYFSTQVMYADAQAQCTQDGGILALVKTSKEADFLRTLVANNDQVYIGLTDIQDEGTWVWADGTPLDDDTWDNWASGDPNNYYNQDCATLTGDEEWADTYCADEGHPRAFICQKPTKYLLCVDKDGQCERLLSGTPDMCTQFKVFSNDRCRYTCGVCSQTDTPACQVPDPSQNAEKVDSAVTSLRRGQSTHYKCKDGKVRVSGDTIRGCTKSGALTGADLVCADTTTTIVAAGELTDSYYSVVMGGNFYLGLSDQWRITHAGEVTRWEYFSHTAGLVAFQVWRRCADQGQRKFQLVGHNVIYTQKGINWQSDVLPAERIQVQEGDMIGLYMYYWDKASIPYAECSPEEGNEASQVIEGSKYYNDPSSYILGDTFSFDDKVVCHHYAFKAVVAPSNTAALVTVAPGELRNYGRSGSTGYFYMGVADRWRITRPGEVTRWDYFSANVGEVAFQVWRRRSEFGFWQFELIGQNIVQTTNGLGYVDVAEADRIQVQANDFIGLYYSNPNPAEITFKSTSRDADPGSEGVVWSSHYWDSTAAYSVGKVYGFHSGFTIRFFSFQATVKGVQPE